MASYDGFQFDERGSGGILVPIHGAVGNVGARPYAVQQNGPQIDLGGTVLYTLSMPIRCDADTLDGLRYDVGVDDNLVYAGGTVPALLIEVKNGQKVKDTSDLYFATLDFLIRTATTTLQFPTMTITVDGNTIDGGALDVTVTHGVEQSAGQATIGFPSAPSVTEGGSVSVALGVNFPPAQSFAGTVTGRQWEHYPTGVGLDCRDRMEYLTYPYGGTERTYTAQTLGTVWQNLGEAQGIDSANMSIEDPGWTVGIVEPVVFRRGDRFLPFMQESMSLAGYCIFTKGVDSAIYVRPFDENVTGAGTHTLTKGTNILSARREISRDALYNAVQVDGLTYEGASVTVYMATTNADVRTPPGTVSYHIQSNLIESNARGTLVASTFLDHHNFKPEAFSFTLPGTAIEPMDMLIVTHDELGMTGATAVVVQREHRFSSSGYTTTVQAKRITR
jgi:hypothetical protein